VLAGGGGEGEKGVAVVGGRERDDPVLAGLPGFDPVLTRELSAASTASEPLERKYSLSRSPGSVAASSAASSSTGPWVNAVPER